VARPGEGDGAEERPEDLGPLPGGYHGLSREQVADSQRERLIAAMAKEVAAAGYSRVTVTRLTKSASVSTRDFYEHFDGKEDCFLATFDAIRDHLAGLVEGAAGAEQDWPHQVIAGLRAVVEFFADEPDLARLCLLEATGATQATAAHFREAVLSCAPGLARGREEMSDPDSLLPDAESAIIGGAVSLATRKVVAGETDRLPRLLPDLVEFTLSPFLGEERASGLAGEIAGN
jgi:AcrR family transcriptional regulator